MFVSFSPRLETRETPAAGSRESWERWPMRASFLLIAAAALRSDAALFSLDEGAEVRAAPHVCQDAAP